MNPTVDILLHESEGFKVLVKYGSWRTAILNVGETTRPETFAYVEKHNQTDEVFVLLKGKACLVVGDDNGRLDSLKPDSFSLLPLEPYKTYNVRKSVWHGVVMSEDASIYLVENIDTGKPNGTYYTMTDEERKSVINRVPF